MDPKAMIGHVHLKVSDLERSIEFYRDVLGFDIVTRMGDQSTFLSVGGYHHHIGLNTWESQGGKAAPRSSPGLYHFAVLLPDRKALASALKRLNEHQWPIEGAADHGVSEAIYLSDPDGNGIELYVDRPQAQWPRDAQGKITMYTRSLDLEGLLNAP